MPYKLGSVLPCHDKCILEWLRTQWIRIWRKRYFNRRWTPEQTAFPRQKNANARRAYHVQILISEMAHTHVPVYRSRIESSSIVQLTTRRWRSDDGIIPLDSRYVTSRTPVRKFSTTSAQIIQKSLLVTRRKSLCIAARRSFRLIRCIRNGRGRRRNRERRPTTVQEYANDRGTPRGTSLLSS